ncbi:MAG: bifunctional adenosylcobinamide kinase/adenosylcobinamide-phosphate guanylyltransferase [Leptolyngbyaceae cyanobacterium bins.59]|nr:bifunctional adenosylcobinamide kinase/adenosylcobinamide-phosphate guanylyltransferase [Leptolyngbyaceae cyanobacterium bins.59]
MISSPDPARLILVTGPARSGKSEWAERLADRSQRSVLYIATAAIDPADLEWQTRIASHRHRRPAHWQTQEIQTDLAGFLQSTSAQDCLLIDSLGTWLANLLEQSDEAWIETQQSFLANLKASPSSIILVAEEVGWGVVPAYPLGRTFRDRLGSLTRCIGAIADQVYLVTGGYVLNLSQLGIPLPKS